MRLKRVVLQIGNAALRPLGVQVYRRGLDMRTILRDLAKHAGRIGTIIDIGASDGRWSEMAMALFNQTRVIGVEPLSEREAELRDLKRRRGAFDYVLCVAGDLDGAVVDLAVSTDLDGSTVGGSAGRIRKVPSDSVDAIVKRQKCSGPFILKFDTHGYEVPILRGASNTLKETSYIVMEVYNYRHTEGTLLFYEMCALLDGMGFRCFNMADPLQRPLDKSLWQMDLFFARKDDAMFRSSRYEEA